MTNIFRIVSAAFVLVSVSFSPPCRAGLDITPPNGAVTYWTKEEIGPDLWKVKVLLPAPLPTIVRIKRVAPFGINGTVIEELEIVRPPSTSSRVHVEIGSLSSTAECPKHVNWIHTTEDQSNGAKAVEVTAWINDSLVKVEHVNYLTALLGATGGGDLRGPVTCVTHPTDSLGSLGGWIDVRSVGGSLRTDVIMKPAPGLARLGIIMRLDFRRGEIGKRDVQGNPVLVDILADRYIDKVFGKEIHARIMGTNLDPNDPRVDSFVRTIGLVETNPVRFNSATGRFTGEIRAHSLGKSPGGDYLPESRLKFRGEVTGRIWLQEIVGGYPGEYDIVMPSNALKSSVALSVPEPGIAPAVCWDGPVGMYVNIDGAGHSNDIVLEQDDGGPNGYTPPRTAASLGGGAVGLVPFHLHRDDSFPLHQQAFGDMSDRPSPLNPIKRRFYGPGNWDPADGTPFIVQRRRLSDAIGLTDETCGFTQTLESVNGFASGTVVLLIPASPLPRGYEYIVSRRLRGDGSNVLRCDLPHLSVVSQFEMWHGLSSPCPPRHALERACHISN